MLYDFDGTFLTSLVKISVRVQQPYTHCDNRLFVPEHDTSVNRPIVRYTSHNNKYIKCITGKCGVIYTDITEAAV